MPEPTTFHRTRIAVSGGVLAGAVAVVVALPIATAVVVAVVAVAVAVIWWPMARTWLPWLAAAAGIVSLAATGGHLIGAWPGVPAWGIMEAGALCLLVWAVVRWASVPDAVFGAGVAGLGSALSVLHASPESGADELSTAATFYVTAFWALPPIAAATLGLYGRHLQARRERAVADAQRAQRLDLARDLHDYVAHDVSGMIAQAQAAQMLSETPPPVREALGRIEAAGQAAMASMDATLHLLAVGPDAQGAEAPDDLGAHPRPGLAELPAVVERFEAAGRVEVRLDIAEIRRPDVPREITSTVHRVVVEALTNVRRHAPAATFVRIEARRDDGDIVITITNDAGGGPIHGPIRHSGTGLAGLTERVAALSGTLRAGPCGDGWQVAARIPQTTRGVDGR